MSLPKGSWGAHRIDLDGVRDLVFFEASVKHDSTSPLVYTSKAVHVKMDLNVDVFVFNKRLETSVVGIEPVVSSLGDLEQTLVVVDAIPVCSGGPSKSNFPRASPESAYVDARGNWRHKKCPMVLEKGSICRASSSLSDTLRIHTSRIIASLFDHSYGNAEVMHCIIY